MNGGSGSNPTDQASDSLNSVFLEMGLEMNYDSDHKVCLEIGPDLSGTVVKLDGWDLEDLRFYWTWSIDQVSKYVFDWLVVVAAVI